MLFNKCWFSMHRKEKTHLLREKRYSFGDAIILATDWMTDWITFTATLHFISRFIRHAQINDELYTFSNFFNQETNL